MEKAAKERKKLAGLEKAQERDRIEENEFENDYESWRKRDQEK